MPEVESCEELLPEESTFGCTEQGICSRRVVGCNPSNEGVDSDQYTCCSDDPAALGGGLPNYLGRSIDGRLPLFSGANNALSATGACIDTSRIANGLREPEAQGCPIPCNPTWPSADVERVCGTGQVCCQTRALRPRDCIFDEQQDRYRPVRGTDIPEKTDWRPSAHQTHQDPNGQGCETLAQLDTASELFRDCINQLSVADRRGFCTAAGNCCADARYVDACERIEPTMPIR